MRLVLVFVALLLSLPLSPQARPKGYELDYYRVRLESVETDGARGGVIGNPENEQGFTTPGYRDSTIRVVFTFEPTHVDFSLTNESDSDFGIIWDEAVFECRRGGVSPGCEAARQTRRAGSFRGREGKLCFGVACRQEPGFLQSRPQTVGIRESPAGCG